MLEPNCICLQEQLLTFWEFCSLTAKATNQNLTSFLRTGFVCLFVFSIYHLAVPVVVHRIFRVACRLLVVAHGIQCPDQRVNLGPHHWVLTILVTGPPRESQQLFCFIYQHTTASRLLCLALLQSHTISSKRTSSTFQAVFLLQGTLYFSLS